MDRSDPELRRVTRFAPKDRSLYRSALRVAVSRVVGQFELTLMVGVLTSYRNFYGAIN